MGKVIPFTCPKCGNEVLIARMKIKSVPDFEGTICKNCGYAITEEDILTHARSIVGSMIAKTKDR